MQITLYSPRLMLRLLDTIDASEIAEIAGEKEIADTTLSLPHPYPVRSARVFIQRRQAAAAAGDGFSWAIRLRKSKTLLGVIGIRIDKRNRHAELGYWIGKQHWGQGYCTEAARRVIAFVFEQLKLNKVWAAAMTKNPASYQVMEKVGMKHEGVFRQQVLKDGQYEDLTYYSLLHSEYRPLFSIQEAAPKEIPFLREMLFASLFVPEGDKPFSLSVLQEPGIAKYINDWGREGDRALIAYSVSGEPIGSITARLFSQDDPGYGYVADDVPELGMAVKATYRGKGIGTALLKEMLMLLKDQQVSRVSLSVDKRNTAAVQLYERHSFRQVAEEGTALVMAAEL